MNSLYDMFDNSIALELGVSTKEYIEKIENMPYNKAEKIIMLIFEDKIEEAKTLFGEL